MKTLMTTLTRNVNLQMRPLLIWPPVSTMLRGKMWESRIQRGRNVLQRAVERAKVHSRDRPGKTSEEKDQGAQNPNGNLDLGKVLERFPRSAVARARPVGGRNPNKESRVRPKRSRGNPHQKNCRNPLENQRRLENQSPRGQRLLPGPHLWEISQQIQRVVLYNFDIGLGAISKFLLKSLCVT